MTRFTIFTFKDISGNIYIDEETLSITSTLNYLYKRRQTWKGVYQISVNGQLLYNDETGDIVCKIIKKKNLRYIMIWVLKSIQTKYLYRWLTSEVYSRLFFIFEFISFEKMYMIFFLYNVKGTFHIRRFNYTVKSYPVWVCNFWGTNILIYKLVINRKDYFKKKVFHMLLLLLNQKLLIKTYFIVMTIRILSMIK